MQNKKVRLRIGDVLNIDLGNGEYSFARVLETDVAFYNLKSTHIPSIQEILSTPILFRIHVMDYAIKSARWPVIGHASLEDELQEPSMYFKQDPINGELSLYTESDGDYYERPATREECEGLECAAVWDPEHVEDRLRDHFAGVPNKWEESLKIKD